MKIVSQDYINGINGLSKKNVKITYNENGTTKLLDKDKLFGVTLRQNTDLLRTIMKELEFVSIDAIAPDTNINFKYGVYTTNDYEYVDYGNFIVLNCEKQEESHNYKILAYDNMLKAKKTYTTLQHGTFPMTIKNYINNLCLDIGLEFANITGTFANYDKIIPNDLYANLGYTYFDIFDELSQVTASNLAINNLDKLEVRYITDTNVTINEDYLKTYNITTKQKYGPVNTIVLTRSAESDSIYYPSILPQNPFEIKISENQIMNFDNRDEFLPAIYNILNGLEFYTCEYDTFGITYLELCDAYNLEVNNETYSCLMLNTELIISDGTDEKIYTPMPDTSSTNYNTSSATDRLIERTSLITDKNGKQITALVGRVDTDEELIQGTQLKINEHEARIDVIGTNINENGDIESVKTSKGYTFDDQGLKISTQDEPFNSLFNNKGTYYKDGETILAQFTKDNVIVRDLVLYGRYYYGVNEYLDVENFTKDDAMFVGETYEDNNHEIGFGHFYNGS